MGLELGRGWGSGWDLELGSVRVWGKARLSLLPDDGEVVSHDGDGHGHEEQPGDNDGHRQELPEWRDGRDVTVADRRESHDDEPRRFEDIVEVFVLVQHLRSAAVGTCGDCAPHTARSAQRAVPGRLAPRALRLAARPPVPSSPCPPCPPRPRPCPPPHTLRSRGAGAAWGVRRTPST